MYNADSRPYLLSKIPNYSDIFMSYSDIFSHMMAYFQSCVTLAYSEFCYIQNPGILRTQDIFRT